MDTLPNRSINIYPVLPLRDVVVYPHMVIPLFVGRGKSIKALDLAMDGNKQILLVAQKSAGEDDPKKDEIYDVGTLSNILQMLKLTNTFPAKSLLTKLGVMLFKVTQQSG